MCFLKLIFEEQILFYENTKHKTQEFRIVILFSICSLFFLLSSCLDETNPRYVYEIEKILNDNGLELESINSESKNGLKLQSLYEFEEVVKYLKGKEFNVEVLSKIRANNNNVELSNLMFDVIQFNENQYNGPNNRIQCIHNWRNVYGKIGISGGIGSTYIDFGFTIGTGTGLIENWNSTLEGNVFMISLGKNHFSNSGVAGSSNNYSYTGIYHFTIRATMFVQGIGEIATIQNKKVKIMVEGCTGLASYSFIEK